MKARWAAVAGLAMLLAGCEEESAYPRLGDGAEAYAFDPAASEVRVETKPGEGFIGSAYEMLDNGTPIMVMEDAGPEREPGRIVRGRVRGGGHDDLAIRVERRWLRRK